MSQSTASPCAVGNALLAAKENEQARKEFVRLLRRGAATECAIQGLQTINAPAPPPTPEKKVPCAKADAEFDDGDLDGAKVEYMAVGIDTKCAEAGLTAVREVQRICAEGQANLDLDRGSEARKAFTSALAKNPSAACAKTGIEDAQRHWLGRFLEWIPGASVQGLVALGVLLSLLFLLLLLAYFPWVYRVFARMRLIGRLLSPRLSLSPLDDKATKLDVGAAMTARIKERLQCFRDEALRGGQPDYELDVGTAGEEFADLVSSNSGLQSALGKVREVSDHTKIMAAVVDLLYAALPIRQLTVTGVLDPPTRGGVATTMTLENSGRLEAAATLSGPPLSRDPTASDYLSLSQPTAVWVQYEVARVLSGRLIDPDAAESYALVREGLDRQLAGQLDAARAAYERALALSHRNWAAFVNLTVLEARRSDFPRSIRIGEEAWQRMQSIGGQP